MRAEFKPFGLNSPDEKEREMVRKKMEERKNKNIKNATTEDRDKKILNELKNTRSVTTRISGEVEDIFQKSTDVKEIDRMIELVEGHVEHINNSPLPNSRERFAMDLKKMEQAMSSLKIVKELYAKGMLELTRKIMSPEGKDYFRELSLGFGQAKNEGDSVKEEEYRNIIKKAIEAWEIMNSIDPEKVEPLKKVINLLKNDIGS